jgi:hypothetical protein
VRSSVSACAAISFGRSAIARAISSAGVRSGSGGPWAAVSCSLVEVTQLSVVWG